MSLLLKIRQKEAYFRHFLTGFMDGFYGKNIGNMVYL